MNKIIDIKAREILDSRGNPTVECDIILDDGILGRAAVPSGASTGVHEAIELRDCDNRRYNGKGVKKAVLNILKVVAPQIINKSFDSINIFDEVILSIDGTKNKSNLGANATLALSLAFAKALALKNKKYFFEYLSTSSDYILPVPMMNIINGGSHADNSVDIQEFMIAPIGAPTFSEAIRYGCEVFHSLKSKLKNKGLNTNVGDEGGFAPNINSSNEVIELIIEAVNSTGLKMEKDILLSLDVASTEFYKNNNYHLEGEGKILTSEQMVDYLKKLSYSYPIYSIEDGMSEDDWNGWKKLTDEIGSKIQLVGDDLFVTNNERLQRGIDKNIANSILIKVNQIGSLSETMNAINLAKKNNYTCVISHRSGETEDTSIADISVATSSGQIKTGSLSRTDRTSKYNQLLRIEEYLGSKAKYAGSTIIKHWQPPLIFDLIIFIMNKSLALKNKIYLFFLLTISLFIFIYLLYFLINGQRGMISYFKIKNLNLEYKNISSNLSEKNNYLSDRVKRLQTNSIDLDYLDEKIRQHNGFVDDDELLIVFDWLLLTNLYNLISKYLQIFTNIQKWKKN